LRETEAAPTAAALLTCCCGFACVQDTSYAQYDADKLLEVPGCRKHSVYKDSDGTLWYDPDSSGPAATFDCGACSSSSEGPKHCSTLSMPVKTAGVVRS
jgi:hypothetical protein